MFTVGCKVLFTKNRMTMINNNNLIIKFSNIKEFMRNDVCRIQKYCSHFSRLRLVFLHPFGILRQVCSSSIFVSTKVFC